MIVVLEGLPLSGKTTLIKKLIYYYSNIGYKCKYCSHGHLTNSKLSHQFYKIATDYLNSLNLVDINNKVKMKKYIALGFQSLEEDIKIFNNSENIDIYFLDRHFLGQYVIAQYYSINYSEYSFLDDYIQFVLYTNYHETKRREKLRNDNHGKLTDYILSNEKIFNKFQILYEQNALKKKEKIYFIDNNDFSAIKEIITILNQEIKRGIKL